MKQNNQNNELHAVVRFHPGEELSDKLEEMNMTPNVFAEQSNVPLNIVNAIIAGDAAITADVAVAFETVTGIPAMFWLRQQNKYDEYVLTTKDKLTYIENLSKFTRRAASVLL